jgi:uncharacterized protein YhfF
MTGPRIERYWRQYLADRPAGSAPPARFVDAFFFGFGPEDAADISPLVLAGTKTATGSVLWADEADGKPRPRPGDHWIVTNGGDDPVCVIETREVHVIPFDEAGEEWAREGGEGDRTLASWRDMYWRYIVAECRRIGREPSPKAPLVLERFRVVYREPLRPDERA